MSASFDEISGRQKGLKRHLTSSQITMIAIGGAIGTGLFLGSTHAIQMAGPSVLLSYAIGGLIALLLMGCLAEMTSEHPTSGSFGDYAEFYVNPLTGFIIRYAYWSCVVLAVGTEVTAVGIYMQFWFPGSSLWLWVVIFSSLVIAINLVGVKTFGLMEYWLSMVKVVAICAFIIIGLVILGFFNFKDMGLKNYVIGGGFFPYGLSGMWFAVIISIFSYLSIEMIAVAAGEAKDPVRAVRKAFKGTIFRLVIFYLCSIALMLAIVPWNQNTNSESPFIIVMNILNIPVGDSIFNFVILIAALSAMNSQLYITTRMMFSLSRAGYAPQCFGQVSRHGIPISALGISCLGILVALLLVFFYKEKSFTLMISISVYGACLTWFLIFVTHYFFRKQHQNTALKFRFMGYPYTTLLGAALMLGIMISTLFVEMFKMTLIFGIPFTLFLVVCYYCIKPQKVAVEKLVKVTS